MNHRQPHTAPAPAPDASVRPALISEVMSVLLARRVERGLSLSLPMRMYLIEQRLAPGHLGVLDALRGAAELGYLTLTNLGSTASGIEATLTEAGKVYDPAEQPVLRYAFQDAGTLVVGTLADYARAWQQCHYSGDPGLGTELLTFAHRAGYRVMVDRLTPVYEQNDRVMYRVWAAGEFVFAPIDGRA